MSTSSSAPETTCTCEHYHRERNHQGLHNEVIDGPPSAVDAGRIRRRQPLGGLLNSYCRVA